MSRVGAILLTLTLLAVPTTASSDAVSTGQTNTHTWGEPQSDRGLRDACPDDVFFVTATLRLINPSPFDQVVLTVDHAGPEPLGLATASSPVTNAVVQLGGCDRSFTAFVSGIVAIRPIEYELTFN